ncbi:MAG: hypothetical protein Q7J10_08920 [Methanosarcinaceae archaeon]|nr:hypothetical protein [Methanosarcinaceae archaeon]
MYNSRFARRKEGITAAWEIYSTPTILNRIFNSVHAIDTLRFSSGSSVAYVYESKNKKTMYILMMYSLIKGEGNGQKTISNIKNHAANRGYRIVTTTSIRSPFKKNADRFYERCGFKHAGNDDKHSYYVIENMKRTGVISINSQDEYAYKKSYTTADKITILVSMIAYTFRIRGKEPIVVEIMDKWFDHQSNLPDR